MRFGDLPSWATELSELILESVESVDLPVLPADLLCREPLFDQLIVNLYQPGEVRCFHFLTRVPIDNILLWFLVGL